MSALGKVGVRDVEVCEDEEYIPGRVTQLAQ